MSFVSFEFLIALPVAALIYYLIPARYRYLWVFVLSMAFYWTQGPRLLLVLLASIVSTYASGRALRQAQSSRSDRGSGTLSDSSVPDTSAPAKSDSVPDPLSDRRRSVSIIACLAFNIALLFVFKYLGMFFPAANERLAAAGLLAPIGISFYILQACGYLIDCYRGDIEPENNFFLYAAFVSFFPLIVSGPIARAPKMLPQLKEPKGFDYDTVRDGLLMMVWGFFLKLVLADRIAIFVDTAYAAPEDYAGVLMVLAVILYALQIYCDFMGYSYIAAGTARVLGFDVPDNFDAPYLSASIAEFWRRWHRSLSYWFRDYLYIPLGGNRKGESLKVRNLLIVFAVSGLWHGAAWRFVLWGLVHGCYQVAGIWLKPFWSGVKETLRVEEGAFSHRLLRRIVTFTLVALAWIFFRAETMTKVTRVLKSLCTLRLHPLFDGSLTRMGLDTPNLVLMALALAVLLAADILRYRGRDVLCGVTRQGIWLRWIVYIAAVVCIVVCGVWGAGYDASSFIYAQF